MIVLLPYTAAKLHPDTPRLLEQHAPEGAEIVRRELPPNDYTAYARLLVEAWSWDGDLVIVEHDIGVHAEVFPGFDTCRQPWCGHPYLIGEQLLVCLGCTRFTAHLKASLPGAMAEAAAISSEQDGGGVPPGDWRRMDVRLAAVLERHGHSRHPHEPPVEHFHRY